MVRVQGVSPALVHGEGEELFPGLGVFSAQAQHGAGHGAAVNLLHATHHHAHVPAGHTHTHRHTHTHTHTHTHSEWTPVEAGVGGCLMLSGGICVCVCVCVCVFVFTHEASMTTATPLGCRASETALAICLVRRS